MLAGIIYGLMFGLFIGVWAGGYFTFRWLGGSNHDFWYGKRFKLVTFEEDQTYNR